MSFQIFPTRRGFLKTGLGIFTSLILPKSLRSGEKPTSFWFLHTPTGESWSVVDPVSWSLKNASQPILERARERLVTLDATDPHRVIRLVSRRCKLNLIELRTNRVTVHYWGPLGKGDLRPFFKQHRLARQNIKVVLIERKREGSTVQTGDDFLYGDRLSEGWPMKVFLKKWRKRYEKEPDDWMAAPGTFSGFAWVCLEDHRIPWMAMKSAWRRTAPFICLNCDEPTLLVNFGNPQTSMFNRSPRFHHVCGRCQRLFEDHSIREVPKWMMANLDAEVLPDFDMFWGKGRWKAS